MFTVLTNIEYDVTFKAMYLTGYVPAEKQNYLWQLFENGTLTQVVPLPGIIQLGISSYCQKGKTSEPLVICFKVYIVNLGHEFFATMQTNEGSRNALVVVHTQCTYNSSLSRFSFITYSFY